MKKKHPKDQQKSKKPPQNLATFIPQQFLTYVQEDNLLICPEERAKDNKKYIPEVEPFDIPPEWEEKTEEEINEELYIKDNTDNDKDKETINSKKGSQQTKVGRQSMRKKTLKNKDDLVNKNSSGSINNATATIEEEKPKKPEPKWKDPMHDELINNLPLSFIKMTENNISWLSPEDYILNEKIDENIKRVYPKKDYIHMREDIKEFFKEIKERNKLKEKREKERQEKERIQKEQEEKERIERERLEKERKEKEAKEAKLKKRLSKKPSRIPI